MASNSKKGNAISDSILLLILVFVFAVVAIVGYKAYSEINTDIQADSSIAEVAKNTSGEFNTRFPKFMDASVMTILVILWLFAIAASFRIDTNPMFFIVSIILLIAVLFVGASISNTYQELVSDVDLVGPATSFPMTNLIFNNLLITILVIAASVMIALFGKEKFL